MRVVIDYRAALRERSGVGEYAHQLAASLLKIRASECTNQPPIDLTLFSSSWKDRYQAGADLQLARTIDRRVPVGVLNFAWHRLEWPPIEVLAGAGFDVAHSMHPLLMPARHAAQIVTIHDLNFLHYPERTRAEIRRDYPALARSHAHRADRIVVVSQFTAREVTRLLDVTPDRISICSPGAPDWRPRSGPPPQDGYVLFFGTLEPRKNVGVLLDAYEQLAGRRRNLPPLILAGKDTEQSKEWLERIRRAPLAGLVRHVGYIDPAKRRALYDNALMLVQPSFEEGFGIPVLEAMTVGVPVIASNRGALPEVVGDAGTLVDPEDADAIAGGIERLLDDESTVAAMSAKGMARAQHYSWERTAIETLKAYTEALAHRRVSEGSA